MTIVKLKAMAWAAAYSTAFEIGPVSEATIGHVGRDRRTQGVVDFVVTPTAGLGFILGEDLVVGRYCQEYGSSVGGGDRSAWNVECSRGKSACEDYQVPLNERQCYSGRVSGRYVC